MRFPEDTPLKPKSKMQRSKFNSLFIVICLVGALIGLRVEASAESGALNVKINESNLVSVLEKLGETRHLFENVYRVEVDNVRQSIDYLQKLPGIGYAEKDHPIRAQLSPDDKHFALDVEELTKQWYLPKIKAHQAWDKAIGSGIVIAVIDTGINARHEDLNDGRVIGGHLSYCQVARGDDCLIHISGDLAANVNSDDNGHGTIVAGIIGAVSNNNKGIAGIDWNVKLMPIKAVNSAGTAYPSDVAKGIRWAVDNGAKIINISIGGPIPSGQILVDAVTNAFNKGVLVIAAAGNDSAPIGTNLNVQAQMPVCADGGQNMVIGVAAVDIHDKKADFSNYGSNCIDISAPGTGGIDAKGKRTGLISTFYDPLKPGELNTYASVSGTSVAAPVVSGVAGLMMSIHPDLDFKSLRDRLFASVDNIDHLNTTGCSGSCVGQLGTGRINALKAVTITGSFVGGSVVRASGDSLYLIERGLRRPLSQFVFNQRFLGSNPVLVTDEELNVYPLGAPVAPADGSIIKDNASATVYLVEGGIRQGLSYLAFISRGFRFENVAVLPVDEVASYPLGSPAPVLDGVLVKLAKHPAVYVVSGGTKQLLSFYVFKQRGFDAKPIGILSDEELGALPTSPGLYPPFDGVLIKGDKEATVYVIEAGKRRGVTLAAFQNRGWQFSDIKVLPQGEVDLYQLGEDILN